MPEEIFNLEDFNALLPAAVEVRRKLTPGEELVKLKIRTKSRLFTYKCKPAEAEKIWAGLKVTKVDV